MVFSQQKFVQLSQRLSSSFLWLSLALLVIFFTYLGQIDLPLEQQFVLGWGLIVAMVLLNSIKALKTPLGRIVFLAVTLFVYLRYMGWRTTDTLFFMGPMDFVGTALVYVAEIQVGGVSLLNMFVNLWPLNRPILPLPEDESLYPTVDIFIPTYNEPEDLVQITATACTQINYPKDKLKIYILDDGGTEQRRSHMVIGAGAWQRYRNLNAIADSLGISYLTRARNEHAKAGNINSALKYTSGDLILILDCDHVPTQDFLQNTVGQFLKDPNLFLVQTPHFFVNPDPIERNLGTFGRAPSENEMFYRGAHPAMDFWNASFFCGSAAVLKRRFIEEVGGVCGDTITEDAETALALHGKGYNSAFIERPMVCGLSPETFGDFIVQRSRWCQGMLQICFLKNPVKSPGLTLPQKINYTAVYFFWFFGFSRFVFFIAPTLFILFGLQVYNASSTQVLAFAAPNLFASFIASDYLFGKFRWPLYSELYESVQAIFLLPAMTSVINAPRKPTFLVTPKGQTLDEDFLSPLAGPFYVMFGIMLAALPAFAVKWFAYPMYRDALSVCLFWLLLNLSIALASLGAFWEKHQVRRHYRAWAQGKIRITDEARGIDLSADLTDLSLAGLGAKLPWTDALARGEIITIEVTNSYGERFVLSCKILRYFKQGDTALLGVAFMDEETNYAERVKLVYGDSQRWTDFWNYHDKPPSTPRIAMHFIMMGIAGAKFGFGGFMAFLIAHAKNFVRFLYWLASNVTMGLTSLGIFWQKHQVRRQYRAWAKNKIKFVLDEVRGISLEAELTDLSPSGLGAKLRWTEAISKGDIISIEITNAFGKRSLHPMEIMRYVQQDNYAILGGKFVDQNLRLADVLRLVYG